jgi:hypothetical protein
MPCTDKWIGLISASLLLSAASFGQAPAPRPNVRIVRQPVAKRAVVLPPLPSGPLAQVPMDQLPSTPPQVSFQDGLLTIVAQNSSLGDILREVHKLTGAEIEVPPNAGERVATRLGPGPARDVLASLLNGSSFNYVMVGSVADPNTVASVMLMPKPAGTAGETAAAKTYQPQPQYAPPERAQMIPGITPGTGPGGPVVQQPANDADADADDKDDEDNADEDQAQGQADGTATAPQDGSQPNGGPKSPEEILQMLRQRQTQQGQPGQVVPVPQQIPRPNPQPPDNQ